MLILRNNHWVYINCHGREKTWLESRSWKKSGLNFFIIVRRIMLVTSFCNFFSTTLALIESKKDVRTEKKQIFRESWLWQHLTNKKMKRGQWKLYIKRCRNLIYHPYCIYCFKTRFFFAPLTATNRCLL